MRMPGELQKSLLKSIRVIAPNYGKKDYMYVVMRSEDYSHPVLFEHKGPEVTIVESNNKAIEIFKGLEKMYNSIC